MSFPCPGRNRRGAPVVGTCRDLYALYVLELTLPPVPVQFV